MGNTNGGQSGQNSSRGYIVGTWLLSEAQEMGLRDLQLGTERKSVHNCRETPCENTQRLQLLRLHSPTTAVSTPKVAAAGRSGTDTGGPSATLKPRRCHP